MESVVILPVCSRRDVHSAHSWRHGFLHLRKMRCDGFSYLAASAYRRMMDERELRAQQTLYKKHKHSFKFIKAEEGLLTFQCRNPKCQTYCHWTRWVYDFRTLNSPEDFGLHIDRNWCGKRQAHTAHRFWIDAKEGTVSRRHCHGLTNRVAKYFSGSMA